MPLWLVDEQYGEMKEEGGRREGGREHEQEAREDEADLEKHVADVTFSPPPPPLSLHPLVFRHVASTPSHCYYCYTFPTTPPPPPPPPPLPPPSLDE